MGKSTGLTPKTHHEHFCSNKVMPVLGIVFYGNAPAVSFLSPVSLNMLRSKGPPCGLSAKPAQFLVLAGNDPII